MHMDSYLLSPDILRTKDQSLKSDRRSLNMNEGMSGFCMKSRCGGGVGGGRKCGRWNPTTDQVKVLTDLFQSGLRTPSTDQIQKISSQLSFYGKIESKNVFYWFQNHKARERQKRRRVSAVDQQNEMHGEDKMSSRKRGFSSWLADFTEINQVTEHERVMKTLQLFPLSSLQESESEKMRLFANECRESKSLSCAAENDMDHYPPLDLRLSFL